MLTQPDPTGGFGSLPRSLWGTLATGLPLIAAGELSRRYGFSFGADGQVELNANDGVRPRASPGSDVSYSDVAMEWLRNPLIVAALIAAGVTVVVLLTRD